MFTIPVFPKAPKSKTPKRIAVLTSGGDAPGMNAAIRAVVRTTIALGSEAMGVQRGYSGLIEGLIHPMVPSSVANIIQRGGTILRTSRCPEFMKPAGRKKAISILRQHGIEGLVVIGGDGSFRGARLLHEESGIPVIGIPGTIDNDIPCTDDTIGFDTAVNTGVQLIDKIRDTASSHDRIFLVEVMGRHSGMIALHTGIGGGAESIIVPEVKTSLKSISESIERGIRRGKTSSIIVVAEGCQFGGVAPLSKELEKLGYSTKIAILGHTQRGGSPSSHDRLLASTLGAVSVHALLAGVKEGMVGVQGREVQITSFKKIQGMPAELPRELLEVAKNLAV
ncbi:MAG: 6-phosphofructokinase [Bdellovibrionales bacterium]|nr:6-phosphofructokinase [Bdellovibrionales bacterium]